VSSVLHLVPSAELEPITPTYRQTDESEMGLTYEELSVFGRLRTIAKCGPFNMFRKLSEQWHHRLSDLQVRRLFSID
jgi:NAD+ synthase (glutamine-hydrolysing)